MVPTGPVSSLHDIFSWLQPQLPQLRGAECRGREAQGRSCSGREELRGSTAGKPGRGDDAKAHPALGANN